METEILPQNDIRLWMCLNRTMQYGNYIILFLSNINLKFKSHYVVWKLYFIILIPATTFKSHYVVWKLKKAKEKKAIEGLNRTMQYGNSNSKGQCLMSCIVFKSHYVVWKRKRRQNCTCVRRKFKSHYVVWKRH